MQSQARVGVIPGSNQGRASSTPRSSSNASSALLPVRERTNQLLEKKHADERQWIDEIQADLGGLQEELGGLRAEL